MFFAINNGITFGTLAVKTKIKDFFVLRQNDFKVFFEDGPVFNYCESVSKYEKKYHKFRNKSKIKNRWPTKISKYVLKPKLFSKKFYNLKNHFINKRY